MCDGKGTVNSKVFSLLPVVLLYPVLRFYLETDTTWGYGRALAALSGQPRCLLTLLEPGQLTPLLRTQAVPLWSVLVTPPHGGARDLPGSELCKEGHSVHLWEARVICCSVLMAPLQGRTHRSSRA